MIRVVVIEREYGSGAAGIASALADRLGFTVWDHAVTERIARRLHCDVHAVEQREERVDPTFYRLVKTFMRGSYEDRTGSRLEMLDADSLTNLFEQIITDVANEGRCIIIGRGAAWFLRERTDTCSVFLYASYEEKMRRILASGRSRAEAEDLLERVDRDRAAFVRHYFNMTWPTRELYDLMVNTACGDNCVVDVVHRQIELLNRHVPEAAGSAR